MNRSIILRAMVVLSGVGLPALAKPDDEPLWKKQSAFVVRERDPASELWIDGYGWVQTGKNLAEAGQWPLAQGSYIQAFRKFEHLAKAYPEFESELVQFRIEALSGEIQFVEEKLGADEHEVMMKYLDFVESVETAYELRLHSEYKQALDAFGLAQNILDDLIASRPEDFREAVDTQYRRVEDSIAWITNYLDLTQPRVFSEMADDSVDWGTTRFVKDEDLPDAQETGLSSVLFPEAAATALEPKRNEPGSGERQEEKTGREPGAGGKTEEGIEAFNPGKKPLDRSRSSVPSRELFARQSG